MVRPRPIGMRIPRPYDSEDDFIHGDGLAIGRLGMILIGAPKRPPGITIRFEILLRDGKPIFRGEGRVVAHRVHANGREGLEVRFTRLDSRSKTLVERVLQLRRSGELSPATPPPSPAAGSDEEKEGKAATVPRPGRLVRSVPPSAKPQPHASEHPVADQPTEQATGEVSPAKEPLDVRPESFSEAWPHAEQQPETTLSEAVSEREDVLDSAEFAPVESPAGEDDSEQAMLDSGQVTGDGPRAVEASVPQVETDDREPLEQLSEGAVEQEPVHDRDDAEILDEDPTPFAPSVMFEQVEQAAPAEQAEPAEREEEPLVARDAKAASDPMSGEDVAAALSKLRERAGELERLDSASHLLDRLRERAKAT